MSKSPVLAVSHSIYLTRDQRYQLLDGSDVTVIGVSVPVWFRVGTTSEPAAEVFCKYHLISSTDQVQLKHTIDGYEVNIPRNAVPSQIPLELWSQMGESDRQEFLKMNPAVGSVKNLEDEKDGGSEWFFFRQYNKADKPSDGKIVHLMHYVDIKDISELVRSLC